MFDVQAASALTAGFLRHAPDNTLNDLRLMKLLYLAERESFWSFGASITGATFYSMPNGPVLSEVLDLMRGRIYDVKWHNYIEFIPYDGIESNRLRLLTDLDPASILSEAEVHLIDSLWEKYRTRTKWNLVNLVHSFPEWDRSVADPKATVKRIDLPRLTVFSKGFALPLEEAEKRAADIDYYEAV